MKKITSFLALAATLMVIGTGCLKDKDFEAQRYGLQIENKKGVSFPAASGSSTLGSPIITSVNSQATPQTIDGPGIALEQNGVAETDVHVTVALDDALVIAAGYTPLPAGTYTAGPLNITIPKGSKLSDALKITIPNSTLLNPSLNYGVGFRITAVDAGYEIVANMKEIVVAFGIKNKYDGRYKLTITQNDGWLSFGIASNVTAVYPGTIDLETSGENSVVLWNNFRGDDLLPGFTGGLGTATGATAFGAVTPKFVFNTATDALTSVVNTTPDDGRGRTLVLIPNAENKFNPANHQIVAHFYLTQTGRNNLVFRYQFDYQGPRP